MRHVPADAGVNGAVQLDEVIITAARSTHEAGTGGRSEAELLANWDLPAHLWRQTFADRMQTFVETVAARINEPGVFDRLFELAESRRREFRRRPLAEFRLTTPVTNVPEDAPLLEFAEDGSIREKHRQRSAP
jgi:hypothetical protein